MHECAEFLAAYSCLCANGIASGKKYYNYVVKMHLLEHIWINVWCSRNRQNHQNGILYCEPQVREATDPSKVVPPRVVYSETVEARAQQEDDADDVKPRKNRLKKKPRKNRLKKKHFDDAFDNLPDHDKELMLEVGKRGGAQGSKTRIINTMFEKDGRAK